MKGLTSLCLNVISIVLNKYDSINYGTSLWDMFFMPIQPSFEKFMQESGSSETPSSLFTCFLEMSNKYLNLGPFLKREKSLIPNIMLFMSIKSVSKAMVSTILSFDKNLPNLEHGNHENQDNIMLHGICF